MHLKQSLKQQAAAVQPRRKRSGGDPRKAKAKPPISEKRSSQSDLLFVYAQPVVNPPATSSVTLSSFASVPTTATPTNLPINLTTNLASAATASNLSSSARPQLPDLSAMSSGSSFAGGNLVTSILAANPPPISPHVTAYNQASLTHTSKLSQQSFKSGESKGFYSGPYADSRAKQFVQCGQVVGSCAGASTLATAGPPNRTQGQSLGKDSFGCYSNIDYSYGEPVVLSDLTSSSSLSNELAGSNVVSVSQLSNEMPGNPGTTESSQAHNSNFGLLNFNDLGIDLLDSSSYNFN